MRDIYIYKDKFQLEIKYCKKNKIIKYLKLILSRISGAT